LTGACDAEQGEQNGGEGAVGGAKPSGLVVGVLRGVRIWRLRIGLMRLRVAAVRLLGRSRLRRKAPMSVGTRCRRLRIGRLIRDLRVGAETDLRRRRGRIRDEFGTEHVPALEATARVDRSHRLTRWANLLARLHYLL
jgi:hypothetical protein